MDASFAQRGIKPQRISRIIRPSSSWRITGMGWVGAMLNRGRSSRNASAEAEKRRRRSSNGTVKVNRPHMGKPPFFRFDPTVFFYSPRRRSTINAARSGEGCRVDDPVSEEVQIDQYLLFRFTKQSFRDTVIYDVLSYIISKFHAPAQSV